MYVKNLIFIIYRIKPKITKKLIMGNKQSFEPLKTDNLIDPENNICVGIVINKQSFETLKTDRLIDAENNICIGIVSKKQSNPYSSQAIRIGLYGKLKRLEKFIELDNNLIFEYEDNTTMTLSKKNNDIIINVKEPETSTNIIKPMDLIIREVFKEIGWKTMSDEYDKIPNFIIPKFSDIKTDIDKQNWLTIIKSEIMER